MGMLDHWHPVLRSSELRDRPVGVTVAGQPIVVARSRPAGLMAFVDECPHRRMRLSRGTVVGDRLQCPYHGWTFDREGQGESPGTPKLHACLASFDVVERHGAIWVKSKESNPSFPEFDVSGYRPLAVRRHRLKIPLELVLDNFCEIEHTPTTHAVFGYELARMAEVTVRFEPTPTTVRVVNAGPCKPLGPFLRLGLGVRRGDFFNDDWTTYFSPVYSVYDHWWTDPATGRESKFRWRVYVFFTPTAAGETEIMAFAYAKSKWPGPSGGMWLFGWLMRMFLEDELNRDFEMLSGLASHETGIEGLKLSRFDRVLGLNRERIDRVYRGRVVSG